jgi:uncharacterized protein YjiS (DUF1127 family)
MLFRILAAFRRISARRRMARGLRALDDHQLHDLGVTRDQIGAYVRARTHADASGVG